MESLKIIMAFKIWEIAWIRGIKTITLKIWKIAWEVNTKSTRDRYVNNGNNSILTSNISPQTTSEIEAPSPLLPLPLRINLGHLQTLIFTTFGKRQGASNEYLHTSHPLLMKAYSPHLGSVKGPQMMLDGNGLKPSRYDCFIAPLEDGQARKVGFLRFSVSRDVGCLATVSGRCRRIKELEIQAPTSTWLPPQGWVSEELEVIPDSILDHGCHHKSPLREYILGLKPIMPSPIFCDFRYLDLYNFIPVWAGRNCSSVLNLLE
ncbi:hypothetical protein RND71_014474 [Anisodus tanguticus]|uniref:Uncharacterized protein n=1 Tax=Anisodus tanguticus TaxID=243964 RepID=A0AAE1VMS6_9SOLA|nr:hypothetical protein RND71_014474 [Anisodus tanguticus]